MNRFPLLLLATAFIAAPFGASFAEDAHDHQEERVHHYAGDEISSKESAIQTIETRNAEIAKLLEAEKLEDSALEKIHEISYSLENAVDYMITNKSIDQAKLAALDEAVQAIHFASENHEEAKVREWFTKLVEPASGDAESAAAEAPAKKAAYDIIIKDHKFSPETITVPAGEKIKLIVDNQDPTPEEFESHDMNREKIIAGNSKATIYVGPLKPGKYHYFGEFNMDSANGYVIAE